MDALIAYIDNGVTAALKAEAEKSSQGSFDKDEVETISEHIWEYYVSNVSDNPARPIYELDMRGLDFDDILDNYREDRLSAYYATMIG